jgi:two-component system phosphate regulon sensor histidine kinase PhoR
MSFKDTLAALQVREHELRQDLEAWDSALEELRNWNESYFDTLAVVTHELKNQLASMKINLLALREGHLGDLTADQEEALDDVLAAATRAEGMILNNLNLARLEKGEIEISSRPLPLAEQVISPLVRDLRGWFRDRDMQLEIEIPAELTVHGDLVLLQSVLQNLLVNAAKYGRSGGRVRVWAQEQDGCVAIHVWNEGEGVAPDGVDQLFHRFSRLEDAAVEAEGMGLGLFLAREIATAHSGRLEVESEYGAWIDFVLTLPRHDVVGSDEDGEPGAARPSRSDLE